MPSSKTYTVKNASEFPNWKQPCPECGKKYPDPAISQRRDGTAAYCKSCGTNWKIATETPEGWNQMGAKLAPTALKPFIGQNMGSTTGQTPRVVVDKQGEILACLQHIERLLSTYLDKIDNSLESFFTKEQ